MERDKKDYPTAIFAFNDFMAIGVIQALKDLSLRVPEDISVAGLDVYKRQVLWGNVNVAFAAPHE